MTGRLAGKTAIITGAARGIGQAIAMRYAEEGCNLALCDLNLEGIEAVAAAVREKGVDATAMRTDVTVRADLEQLVGSAVEHFGTVDILVNNAGIFFNAPFDTMTDEQWDQMMTVNTTSIFRLTQIVIRHWLERERTGAIVNLASISGVIAFNNSSAYCASKAAVAALTRCIALEFGPRGIRANSMAPGIIHTSMLPNMDDANRWASQKIPLRRMGKPEDVAELALFLGSDESRYITGDTIFVDGGWMLE